jgi:hypothetical protein
MHPREKAGIFIASPLQYHPESILGQRANLPGCW